MPQPPCLRALALAVASRLSLFVIALPLSPTVHGVDAAPAWQAAWIDAPADASPGSPSLADAIWIWNDVPGSNPSRQDPAGLAYLRRVIELPAGAQVGHATMRITADNGYTLWVNGTKAAHGTDWHKLQTVDVSRLLKPGRNVLAVEAINNIESGALNPAGLIAALDVTLTGEGITVRHLTTDSAWKTAATAADGWRTAGFDDSAWSSATEIAKAGSGAWRDAPLAPDPATTPAQNTWRCFRTSFALPKVPGSAPTRIAVDSKYWLWVNGRGVVFEGGLKRGPNPHDGYYDTIDLAPYLKAGKNTVAVLTWYWGKDGFSHRSSGQPGFLFEMHAGAVAVASSPSWKVIVNPAYGTPQGEQPNFRLAEGDILFDARDDPGDWTAASFNDAAWPTAREVGATGAAPWGAPHERPIPQWKNYGLREYANAAELPKVSTGKPVIAELPYNAQVTPYLEVDAPAGLTIDLRTDNYRGGGEPNVRGEYITREGRQSYESYGWMNGQAVIYTIPAGVKIRSLKYRETGFDTEFSGSFTCDDPFLNKLWEKSRRTLYVTMRDNFMDCPDRERAQWWGDAVNEIGESFYALSPSSAALARKAIYDLCGWQRADHVIYSPIPGAWDRELPQQMLASVGEKGFWTYYFYTGDKQTVVDAYPHVRDFLSLWSLDTEGLVIHRKGDWDWADWGKDIDARVLDQAWYCLALEGAANIARLAGATDEATAYITRRDTVITATRKLMWNGTAYRDPNYRGANDDRANALCVVAGIASPDQFPAIRQVLHDEMHASPYMEKYVLEALMQMHAPDDALSRMKTRYGAIVADRWSTLPELWEAGTSLFGSGTLKGTHNHAWSGGPLTILSQYAAGLAPLAPAWSKYEVRPQPGSLKSIDAKVDTAAGLIAVELRRDAKRTELKLVSPKGTSALVSLPKTEFPVRRVTVNGHLLWEDGQATGKALKGVVLREDSEDEPRFEAGPGKWRFDWTY